MALVQCQDCGRDVSTRARHCVHCGNPYPVKRCSVVCAILTGTMVALLVMGGLCTARIACHKSRPAACIITSPTAPKQIAPAPEAKPAEKQESPKEY